MTPFLWAAVGVLLVYFALRVVQMKRASMPFLVAYPLFVLVLLGGSVAVFLGASWIAGLVPLAREAALACVFGVTAIAVIVLWRIARRLIA